MNSYSNRVHSVVSLNNCTTVNYDPSNRIQREPCNFANNHIHRVSGSNIIESISDRAQNLDYACCGNARHWLQAKQTTPTVGAPPRIRACTHFHQESISNLIRIFTSLSLRLCRGTTRTFGPSAYILPAETVLIVSNLAPRASNSYRGEDSFYSSNGSLVITTVMILTWQGSTRSNRVSITF